MLDTGESCSRLVDLVFTSWQMQSSVSVGGASGCSCMVVEYALRWVHFVWRRGAPHFFRILEGLTRLLGRTRIRLLGRTELGSGRTRTRLLGRTELGSGRSRTRLLVLKPACPRPVVCWSLAMLRRRVVRRGSLWSDHNDPPRRWRTTRHGTPVHNVCRSSSRQSWTSMPFGARLVTRPKKRTSVTNCFS